jgi:hypothetical protein
MNYTYLLENNTDKHLSFNDIINDNDVSILNIICYYIDERYKYPFLQFMMEKIPFCNDIVKEEFILPYIFLTDTSINIQDAILQKIKFNLSLIDLDCNKINEDMYKGIVFIGDNEKPYALVNITGISVHCLNLTRNSLCWFVLPSEIINTKKVCNIDIDNDDII